jgi:putative transposase
VKFRLPRKRHARILQKSRERIAAKAEIGEYFRFYNTQRPHQTLGYRTPAEVYGNLVESVSRGMVESIEPITTRKAGSALNRVPILSY